MNQPVKIAIYVALAIASLWFARAFYSEYKASGDFRNLPVEEALESALDETNQVASQTLATNTNSPASTNDEVEANLVAATNTVIATTQATNPPGRTSKTKTQRSTGTMVVYLGLFLVFTIILGLFVAHDISSYMGNKAVKVLFNDDLEGVKNPEYDEAEQDWANGRFLEAIQKMRDYLKKNPREQYVALRIAEIYEKDLNNPLAAALEYEEVLKHKLPDERWGWAAIHLANIYSGKLNREPEAIALLRRICLEYSATAASKKAKERLEKVDPEFFNSLEEAPAPAATETPGNLPRGFRPKK